MIFRRMPGRTVFALRLHFHHDLVLAHHFYNLANIAAWVMQQLKLFPEQPYYKTK